MNIKRIILKPLYFSVFILLFLFLISQHWEIQIGFENLAKYLYPNEANRNAELFKILLTVIGGIGVFYSLYLAYKRAKATDKGIELQAQAINKQSEQLELSRKGQVNDRFKNAIEHLGNDKQPIILGGVVELHQIANEEKEKYAAVVFNILTSYLRSVLKVDIPRDDNFSSTVPQTIIDFLFRGANSHIYKGLKANLAHCNFLSLDINESNFDYADFGFSLLPRNIVDVSFEKAKFGRANFTVTNIINSKFNYSEFHDTIFNQTEIKNSDFFGAKLSSQLFINTRFF
ncbi:pentapeptide repeat-containing protein [Flavobacterium macacae]|nr:pentapeptide repeat-containing protein [Flavobacterium macacae]